MALSIRTQSLNLEDVWGSKGMIPRVIDLGPKVYYVDRCGYLHSMK